MLTMFVEGLTKKDAKNIDWDSFTVSTGTELREVFYGVIIPAWKAAPKPSPRLVADDTTDNAAILQDFTADFWLWANQVDAMVDWLKGVDRTICFVPNGCTTNANGDRLAQALRNEDAKILKAK